MVKAKKAAQEQVAAKNKKWQEPRVNRICYFNIIVLVFIL